MFIRTSDAVLNSVSFGSGPHTVLALNGWSASWQAWLPTFEVLSTDLRCVSYDTRGTGGSSGTAADISLDVLVDDAVRVLDAHAIERAVLAGESLGGFVSLHACCRHPDRFEALALVAAAPFVTAEAVGSRVEGARRDYATTIEDFVRDCLTEPEAQDLLRWGAHLFTTADPEVAARLFECSYGQLCDLSTISMPTTVVHGTDDLVVPIDAGRYLAAVIPGATLVELPATGHAPTVTRPGEVAAAIVALTRRMAVVDG